MEIRTKQLGNGFEYTHYEPGDFVTPTSSRSGLERGQVYLVTGFVDPWPYFGDYWGVLFLEGEEYGESAEYISPVYFGPGYPKDTPEWLIEVAEGRYQPV